MIGERRKEGERGRLKQSIKSNGGEKGMESDERKVKVDVEKSNQV